ncbi:MAG: hypothetical protein NZM26_05420 [Patescibacteria group bacterium]|nr:hypothetical protein [Patescibacteria group bacterium]
MTNKFVYFLAILFLVFVFLARDAFASIGLVEIKSTTSDIHRCFVSSMLMPDSNFLLAVTCRDLLYPTDNSVAKYYLWSVPVDSNLQPIKLAELGFGRLELRTNVPFRELYVVLEKNFPGQKPTEAVVMRGVVRPLTFLDNPGVTTSTLVDYGETIIVPQNNLSFGEKISEALRRAGVALFLFVVVCVGLVFVVLKSKG